MTQINYSALHNIPAPSWQYTPVPGCYGTKRCSYCGDYTDGSRVDLIGNPVRNNVVAMRNRNHPEFFLYDCCGNCWHALQDCTETSPRGRAHFLLVTLRNRYNRMRGARSGTPKIRLMQRIVNLTSRTESKNRRYK